MSRDYYCIVSGICQMGDEFAIMDDIDNNVEPSEEKIKQYIEAAGVLCGGSDAELASRWNDAGDTPVLHEWSASIREGLKVADEDIEASKDLVLIAGYQPVEGNPSAVGPLFCAEDGLDARLLFFERLNFTDDIPSVDIPTHAIALFNIIPDPLDGLADSGSYIQKNDPEQTTYTIWWQDAGYLVTFSAYCILQTVAPGLEPSVLYKVFTHRDDVECEPTLGLPRSIEYGAISKSFDNYVRMDKVADAYDPEGFWGYLLSFSRARDEEILEEAWSGRGNLWVFKRPDRFPIAATIASQPLSQFPASCSASDKSQLDKLPMEILLLIFEFSPLRSFLKMFSLNRRFRAHFLPRSNELAYRAMRNLEPWVFPSLPIKTPFGVSREREDLDRWEEEWHVLGGIAKEDIRAKVRWLDYWIECSWDDHMRNRRRIWKAAEGIRELAFRRGYLEP